MRPALVVLLLLLVARWVNPGRAAENVAPAARPRPLPNFALLDHHGRMHELRRADARVVVLFFTGNGCPIARQNLGKLRSLQQRYAARGVQVWLVNANPQDDRASIVEEAAQFRSDPLPVLKDDTQGVARMLGVTRTCETFAIATTNWQVFYRGAIDDQFVEGAARPQPVEKYLETALESFLEGRTVARDQTVPRGCLIHFEADATHGERPVSYVQQVAPLLVRKCVGCHRPGDVGSWIMADYAKVKGMSAMIQEVLLARRMPPWEADPHHGRFANDRSLTVAEAQTLLRWIEQGAPRGEGDDPLPKALRPAETWPLGPPDRVLRLSRQNIPAQGVIELRHQILNVPFTNTAWLGAIDVRPGNRSVLHHLTLRTIQPGQMFASPVGVFGWNPGYVGTRFPEGTGLKLEAGSRLHVDLHYTSVGRPEVDQTDIGLYVLPQAPRRPLEPRAAWDMDISIPPGEPDFKATALTPIARDTFFYDFRPHMHYRGSWFRFELLLPDGTRETLLSVPRYDFNWQTTYILAEPRLVPAGAWVLCTGGFDNSARNPGNPDPAARLHWGELSADEMFIGHFNTAPVAP